jgi:hypothetical protein
MSPLQLSRRPFVDELKNAYITVNVGTSGTLDYDDLAPFLSELN